MLEKIKLNRKFIGLNYGIAALTVILIEVMYRRHISLALGWLFGHLFLFVLNVCMIMVSVGIVQLISGKKSLGPVLVVPLSLMLGVLNAGKYSLRNIPVTLDDLHLINEVWALRDKLITIKSVSITLLALILLVGLGYGIYLLYKKVHANSVRVIGGAFVVFSMIIIWIGQGLYDSELDISQSGFIYSISNPTRVKPVASEEIILTLDDKIQGEIDKYVPVETKLSEGDKPNVIIIMSEAFWDINKMGLDLEENPVPYFESLRDESIHGELYVPVIGGGTANTEFEVITGMTVKNLPYDYYMAYTNVIDGPFPSLASIYREQGYKSIAVHPYMSWYYQRYNVYNYFGFDDFYSLEFMGDTEKYGSYTRDSVTFDKVLEVLKDTQEPVFNYTVTMQNHGPYGDARFTQDQRTMPLVTALSDPANYFVNNYIQGLYYSDLALEDFIESLKALDEPTMVVFFGDHLPFLGDDYMAYRDSGYVNKETNEELMQDLRTMSVPYIVWRNFDETSEETEVMNASFLTPKILEWSGAEVPDYLKVISALSEDLPVMMREYGIDQDGRHLDKTSSEYQEVRAVYQRIYENLLSGEVGLDEDQWKITDNSTYNSDIDGIVITDVKYSEELLLLFGSDFTRDMELYINDEPIAYDFISDEEISVKTTLQDEVQLQVMVKDDSGTTTAVSNIYKWLPQ